MAAFTEPPDGRAIVHGVFNGGGHELQTKDGCGRFTEACLQALEARWPGQWKHLKKSGGQNQWNGHAVDGGVHAPTGYFVDMIGNSETAKASPSWHLDKRGDDGGPRYKGRADLFLDVTPTPVPVPDSTPDPPPIPAAGATLDSLSAQLADIRARQDRPLVSVPKLTDDQQG